MTSLVSGSLAAALVLLIRAASGLEPPELAIHDRLLSERPRVPPQVLLVVIGEDDIRAQGHWPISDRQLALALQPTQLQLMRERRFRHPYYWAPFLLISSWL
jgi:CHASE2 domain-containing sensor protein